MLPLQNKSEKILKSRDSLGVALRGLSLPIKRDIKIKETMGHKFREDRIGETINSNYGKATIVEYFGNNNITIKFEDGTIIKNVKYSHFKEGKIRNPNYPSFYGVGYDGIGLYQTHVDKVKTKHYKYWSAILRRAYSENKYHTYKNVIIYEEWHNFQNFAEWFEENYNPEYMQGWHLDKDILIKGNKVYSPETCAFVPAEINSLIVKANSIRGDYPIGVNYSKPNRKYIATYNRENKKIYIGSYNTPEEAFQAYKTEKEKYIKEIADKYKNQITDKVYQALYNYQVEITD